MTITEFLLARIAEDEEADWHDRDCDSAAPPPGPFPCDCGVPARVLAECRARRGLIEAFQSLEVAIRQERDREKVGFLRAVRAGMESGLLTFALPYAGHPDYDKSWLV